MYECADYRIHIKTVEDSLKSFMQDYEHLFSEEERMQLNEQVEQVSEIMQKLETANMKVIERDGRGSDIAGYHNMSNVDFETSEMREEYLDSCLQVFDIENNCTNFANRIWENDLTGVGEFDKNKGFKLLVHAISPLVEEKADLERHIRDNKTFLSTSLITEQQLGTYEDRKVGFVYNTGGIVVASDKNINSDEVNGFNKWNYTEGRVSKEQLLNEGFDSYYALKLSRLMTPKQIEKENMETSRKNTQVVFGGNGQILDRDVHNEIELMPDKSELSAVFCKTMGDKLYSKEYQRAVKIAKIMRLPLIEIDESICRENCGVDPIPENDLRHEEDARISQLRNADVSDRFLRSQLKKFKGKVDKKFDKNEIYRNNELREQEKKVYSELVHKLREFSVKDGKPDKKELRAAFENLSRENLETSKPDKKGRLSSIINKLIPRRDSKKESLDMSPKDNSQNKQEPVVDKEREAFWKSPSVIGMPDYSKKPPPGRTVIKDDKSLVP